MAARLPLEKSAIVTLQCGHTVQMPSVPGPHMRLMCRSNAGCSYNQRWAFGEHHGHVFRNPLIKEKKS